MPFKEKEKKNAYNKINRKCYTLTAWGKTEADIISWLEEKPNKSEYIKSLIRADMEKEKEK